MIGTILVPLDGSTLSERALPSAVALAEGCSSRLVLVYVADEEAADVMALMDDSPAAVDPAGRLEELSSMLRLRRLDVRIRLAKGNPAREILHAADEERADAIVMSTHGRSGLGRWVYGSVADAVLRRATVPVLLTSAMGTHVWSAKRPPRILVPLDGSSLGETAVGLATELAEAFGGSLVLVRVVEPTALVDEVGIVSYGLPTRDMLDAARRHLEHVAGRPGLRSRPVEIIVEPGAPARTIDAVARREGIDLIVMATHGRGGLARLTLGSTATALLHLSTVPLMLVRPARIRTAEHDAHDTIAARSSGG